MTSQILKTDVYIRPVHLKFGVALAISVGGILYAFLTINKRNKPNNPKSSTGNRNRKQVNSTRKNGGLGDDDAISMDLSLGKDNSQKSISRSSSACGDANGFLLPEFDELVKECGTAFRTMDDGFPQQSGSKDQTTASMKLRNKLRFHDVEAKIYSHKTESLLCDNIKLQAQLVRYARALQELHESEKAMTTDRNATKELEKEIENTKKSNEVLRQENSDLVHKLEYLQMLAASALDVEEAQDLKEESRRLHQLNNDLTKEMERIQADRWTDIEELVHLRWINGCLRYELRNFHGGGRKAISQETSKASSPMMDDKVKQHVLERAYKEGSAGKGMDILDIDSDHCPSSQTSCLTDTGEREDMFLEAPAAPEKQSHWKKAKVFAKLKRLLTGKRSSHQTPPRKPKMGRAASVDNLSERFSSVSSVDDEMKIMRDSSGNSSRRSFDLPRSSSRREKSISRGGESSNYSRRNSDIGSETTATTTTAARIQSLTDEEDNGDWMRPQQDAKDELLKYAESLKNARAKPFGKRSTSDTEL